LIAAGIPLDVLRDLWGPGLVFLLLAFWLVRKAWRAARTERELEEDRASPQSEPAALRPRLVAVAPHPSLASADVTQARAEHVSAVAALLQQEPARPAEVLWLRSLGAHAAWLEKLPAGEQVLQVARLEAGRVAQRWSFSSVD
jgi:hypothetical protein